MQLSTGAKEVFKTVFNPKFEVYRLIARAPPLYPAKIFGALFLFFFNLVVNQVYRSGLKIPMDPLSISAGIIALIQATNEVVSLCYNFATAKSTARAISDLLDQLKGLRNVLESLEQFCKSNDLTDPATSAQLGTVTAFCDMDNGPLAKELIYLDERLRPPNWASRDGSRRKALVQSLTWPLKKRKPPRRWKTSRDLSQIFNWL